MLAPIVILSSVPIMVPVNQVFSERDTSPWPRGDGMTGTKRKRKEEEEEEDDDDEEEEELEEMYHIILVLMMMVMTLWGELEAMVLFPTIMTRRR